MALTGAEAAHVTPKIPWRSSGKKAVAPMKVTMVCSSMSSPSRDRNLAIIASLIMGGRRYHLAIAHLVLQ